jgi:hypothetical protein
MNKMFQIEKDIMDLNDEQRVLANMASKSHDDLVNKIRQVGSYWITLMLMLLL